MKKFFAVLTVLFVAVVLTACMGKKYEIAMITDVGTIDDKSFNQGTWEGVKKYAEEHNISYKYYKPAEGTTQAYEDSIRLAVKGGAKVIVTPGYLFSEAIYNSQTRYPEIRFILIDATPANKDYVEKIADNTYAILFNEQESGFLAGYAAVKAGFTNIGFMGGMAVPAVVRYGHGYLQGAEYAANEMGLADGSITVRYTYLGGFGPSPDYKAKAAGWYTDGTQVIFAAAGGAGASVMAAASDATKYVIGVDVDQKDQSSTVITSAKKELATAVYDCLTSLYDGTTTFKIGHRNNMDATNGGVGLPADFSRFPVTKPFTTEQYNVIFEALKNNTDKIRENIVADAANVAELGLVKLNVTVEGSETLG